MRAVIFANGVLGQPPELHPDDLILAADGGAHHLLQMGLIPAWVVGDFDSLTPAELEAMQSAGAQLVRFPARKDYTDLELAIRHAIGLGVDEILVVAALGARWDQTLANLLLPAAEGLSSIQIRLVDGPQEILLLDGGESVELYGHPGDTVSLIPLGGPAHGIYTECLEYPLVDETLPLGSTRGVSNVMLTSPAKVRLGAGMLICVTIHQDQDEQPNEVKK